MFAKPTSVPKLPADLESNDQNQIHPAPARRSRSRLLWTLGIGLGLLSVGIILGKKQLETPVVEAKSVQAKRILPVKTLRAEPVSSYSVSRSFSGRIAALRSSNMGFERAGTLVTMLVDEGDRVVKGQPLARTDVRNLMAQRRQLVAQKAQAEARLSELVAGARPEDISAARAAVRDLEEQLRLQNIQKARREDLYRQGAIAREQLDEFTTGAASLKARIDQAQSNLQELLNGNRIQEINSQKAVVKQLEASVLDLDITVAKSTISAPFAGVVAEKLMDVGTVVGAGEAVLRISESAAPEARIGVPVAVVKQLVVNQRVEVSVGKAQYPAQVTSILPEVNATTRTQIVVLALRPELLAQVTPGQTVRVNLNEKVPSNGYWLPTSALTKGIRGLWTCFTVVPTDADGSADSNKASFEVKTEAVEIVHQDGDRVLVKGTLKPGSLVVANGTHRMVPGQAVEPIPSQPSSNNG